MTISRGSRNHKARTKVRPFDPTVDKMWDEVGPVRDVSPTAERLKDVSPTVGSIPAEEVAKALGGKRAKGKKWRDTSS